MPTTKPLLVQSVYALCIAPRSAGERGHLRRVFAARGQEYCQEAGANKNMSIIWGRSTTRVCAESTQGTRHHLPYAMLMNIFAGVKNRRVTVRLYRACTTFQGVARWRGVICQIPRPYRKMLAGVKLRNIMQGTKASLSINNQVIHPTGSGAGFR